MTYQVPMNEVAVTVAISGLDPEEHYVYLAPFSDRREGPETMADYVNGRRRFFPMVASGAPRMINRDQILWIRSERLHELYESETTLIEKLTIIELTDGSRIEGVVPIDQPRETSRLSDVLNDGREVFLRIDDEGETYYVNKRFIRLVIPR
jgi:hypothetical protein